MPGNISQFQVVIPGQIITATLWNGMETNIIDNGLIPSGVDDYSVNDSEMQTETDPYPGGTTSRPTSLQGEVERIRFQLRQIIGGTYWYNDPSVSINSMKTNFDAHTHDGTANNGPQIAAAGLASNSVTTAKILDSNVTTAKIADLNVTTAKIADLNVTTAKIADSNVTTGKIASNAVDETKIASSVAGNGLGGGAGSALSVNVDNSTIEINSDSLRVKDAGITQAKLASAVVNQLGQNIGITTIIDTTSTGTLVNYSGQGRLLGILSRSSVSTVTITIDGVVLASSQSISSDQGLQWATAPQSNYLVSSASATLGSLQILFRTSLVISKTGGGNIIIVYERAA